MIKVEDNGKKGRFTIHQDDELAGEMTFTWAGEARFIIDHTSVEDKFEGEGLGKDLKINAVEFAREKNVKIIPLCTFAKSVIHKNKNLQDVIV